MRLHHWPFAVPLALLAFALLEGCSQGAEPTGPDAIRLVDAIGLATVSSSVDFDDPPAAFREMTSRTLEVGADDAVVQRGAWLNPIVCTEEPAADPVLVIYSMSAERAAPIAVRIAPVPGCPAAERAFLVDAACDTADLARPEKLESLLAASAGNWTELTQGADGAWFGSIAAVKSGQILACVTGRDAPPGLGAAEFMFPGRKSQWLMEATPLGGSPWARRIEYDHRWVEGLVFGAPGSLSFPLRIPTRRPRFTSRVRTVWDKATTCTLEVRVDADILWSGPLDASAKPLDVDLSRYAGRNVTLTLAARAGDSSLPLVALATPVVEGERLDRPADVILISLDTVRADRMSLYGGPRPTTPSIDQLAQSSLVFESATSAAPWTLPSHVSTLSGQLPDRHGVYTNRSHVPDGLPWLPTDFRRAGYQTMAFTAAGFLDEAFGFATGFESYRTREVAYPLEWAERKQRFNGTDTVEQAQLSDVERQALMNVLGAERRRPMFLFVHSYQAHEYRGKPEVLLRFGADPANIDGLVGGVYGAPPRNNPFFTGTTSAARNARLQARAELMYDASLYSADELVGDIVAALKKAGRLDRTILIITSDHGETLMERGDIGHGRALFREQSRVPLVMHGPGIPPRRVDDLVSLVDLAPTLRALCGLVPAGVDFAPLEDGHSLAAIIDGGSIEPHFVLMRGGSREGDDPPFHALRNEQFKLIETETPSGGVTHSLFDLRADPGEIHDLASTQPQAVVSSREMLDDWVSDLKMHSSDSAEFTLDPETEKTLKGLGYLGTR